MIRRILPLSIAFALIAIAMGGQTIQKPLDMLTARDAWNDGDYPAALNAYIRLLNAPGGEKYLEEIALQTGELFHTDELTTDGRNPKMSPDGTLVSYETGPAKSTITRIQRVEGRHETVADLPGTGLAFSGDGKVAYLKTPISDEYNQALEALDKAPATGAERTTAQQQLNRLQAKLSRIVIRDLKTQRESELNTGDLLKSTLVFGVDNQTVYFMGAPETETKRSDIYAISPGAGPAIVTDVDGFKTSPVLSPSGKVMIVTISNLTPFPVPGANAGGQRGAPATSETPAPAAANAPPAGGGPAQGEGGRGAGGQQRFGLVDLSTHSATILTGSAPVFSPDGSAVAYFASVNPKENGLMVMPIGGTATTVLQTTDQIASPAFSPDGKQLVYQRMLRENYEVFLIGVDGAGETRITQEIQHDVVPRFLSPTRLLTAIGEPRYRRSYIYDLTTKTRTKIFHNNTVRTIAPEYSWSPSPDGSVLLVSAERDGDTISTERGVYLVDLNRKVTKGELLDRLQRGLSGENELRAFAAKIYKPLTETVRAVVDEVSSHRIYDYEKGLTSFGSRHVSQPGNAKAGEYLFNQYASFGYKPEYQWFAPRGAANGKSANVIARLTGTENPDLIYTLSSHYDSVVAGPGADDDGSGIAAMLEAARVLADHPLPATIVFVCMTGEESGTLGSREFARIAKEGKWAVAGSLNNDMIGWSEGSRLTNTIRYSNSGIRDIQHAAALMFTKLVTYDSHYYKGTDAANLFDAFGDVIGGMGGYPLLGTPHYHTAHDQLDTLNFRLISETAKATVAALIYMASTPSPVKQLMLKTAADGTTEITWAASPEKSVRSYVISYGPAQGPMQTKTTTETKATLRGLKAGTVVMVKAVNARGMEGWDWSRATVEASTR